MTVLNLDSEELAFLEDMTHKALENVENMFKEEQDPEHKETLKDMILGIHALYWKISFASYSNSAEGDD